MRKAFFKFSLCILGLFGLMGAFLSAQDGRLPREPEKLIDRVQKFWTAITSGQRVQALEFVLPEKKNLFLSGTPMPILKAKVLGLDLTTDSNRAVVRITLDMLAKESASGRTSWTISDTWVWNQGNWYLNLANPPDVFPRGDSAGPVNVAEVQRQLNKNFEILRDTVDVGRLVDGQSLQVELPIRYSGEEPVQVELAVPNPLVSLAVTSTEAKPGSKNLLLLVTASNWDGPFNLPLPFKVRYGEAAIERTVILKGEVLVPIVFRQDPIAAPTEEDGSFSLFVRNNTDQERGIRFISVDARLNVVKRFESLPANSEKEIVLKRIPGRDLPDQIYIQLDTPLYGRDTYNYWLRSDRH